MTQLLGRMQNDIALSEPAYPKTTKMISCMQSAIWTNKHFLELALPHQGLAVSADRSFVIALCNADH
jgi:hypothetical protein